jgi:glycosyltransferase involved in cell wall biosynthesis
MRMTKVAIVHHLTPKTSYTRLLERGFVESGKSAGIVLYGEKGENISDLPNARNVWSSRLYPFQIFRQVIRDRSDIVHIQHEFSTFGPFWANLTLPLLLLLMKIARVKIVITNHVVIPKEEVDNELVGKFFPQLAKFGIARTLIKFYVLFLYRTMIMSSDRIIVHGGWYKKTLLESYKAPPYKIDIIPYGVNEENGIDPILLQSWRKRVRKHKIILFFGDVSPRKDIETLIRAFAIFVKQHREYLLIIAGREETRYRRFGHELRSTAKELGISNDVIFTGFIRDEEIHVLYSISEAVVFPYLYGFEGPSGPLAFAIQHNIPVIGNKVGHLIEEIHDMREGILVPPRNVQALAQAMTKLMDDKKLRNRLSENLRKKGETTNWKEVASRTHSLYKKLVTNS